MERASFEMERFPSGGSNAFLSCTQYMKFFCSFGYNICKQFQGNSTNSLPSDVHVEEDSGVTGAGGLSLGGRVRHCGPQTRLRAPGNTPWPPRSPNPQVAPSAKNCSAGEPLPTGVRNPWPNFWHHLPTSAAAASGPLQFLKQTFGLLR